MQDDVEQGSPDRETTDDEVDDASVEKKCRQSSVRDDSSTESAGR